MDTGSASSNTQACIRPAVLEDAPGIAALLVVLGYPCSAEEAAVRQMHLRDEPEQQIRLRKSMAKSLQHASN